MKHRVNISSKTIVYFQPKTQAYQKAITSVLQNTINLRYISILLPKCLNTLCVYIYTHCF